MVKKKFDQEFRKKIKKINRKKRCGERQTKNTWSKYKKKYKK